MAVNEKEHQAQIKAHFIRPLLTFFDMPKNSNGLDGEVFASLISLIARSCPGATLESLSAAVERIATTRKARTFPPVPVLIEAINAPSAGATAVRSPQSLAEKLSDEESQEAHRFARQAFHNFEGRTALDQGWFEEMYDFIRRFLRLPYPAEKVQLIRHHEIKVGRRDYIADLCERQPQAVRDLAQNFRFGNQKLFDRLESIFENPPVPVDPQVLAAAAEAFEMKRKRVQARNRSNPAIVLGNEAENDLRVREQWEGDKIPAHFVSWAVDNA